MENVLGYYTAIRSASNGCIQFLRVHAGISQRSFSRFATRSLNSLLSALHDNSLLVLERTHADVEHLFWTVGHFSFRLVFRWDQRLRPNQTARLWSQSDVEFNQSKPHVIANVIGDSSLISPYLFVFEAANKSSDFHASELNL